MLPLVTDQNVAGARCLIESLGTQELGNPDNELPIHQQNVSGLHNRKGCSYGYSLYIHKQNFDRNQTKLLHVLHLITSCQIRGQIQVRKWLRLLVGHSSQLLSLNEMFWPCTPLWIQQFWTKEYQIAVEIYLHCCQLPTRHQYCHRKQNYPYNYLPTTSTTYTMFSSFSNTLATIKMNLLSMNITCTLMIKPVEM